MRNDLNTLSPLSLSQRIPSIEKTSTEKKEDNEIQLMKKERENIPSLNNEKMQLKQENLLRELSIYFRNQFKHCNNKNQYADAARYEQKFDENNAQREINDNIFKIQKELIRDEVDGRPIGKNRIKRDIPLDLLNNLEPTYKLQVRHAFAQSFSKSSKEFCEEIAEIIGETKKDYLQIYEKVLEKYIMLFKSLSDILSELPKLINDGKDNKVTVNSGKLKELLEALKNKYKNEVLYPTEFGKKVSQEEAEDWAEKLGLPDSCVQSDGRGGYVVKFDLSPIDEMINGLGAVSGEISSAKYQAWKAGFDAQVEKINNYVQTLSQKYTTANSTYDNLVKVLSSTITSLYDADKEFLKN